jgi:hypothetical protein
MMRFAKALALVLALGAGVQADVLISGGAAGTTGASAGGDNDPVYTSGTTANQYAGFSFLTTGSSAANGQWALNNLKFNLKADTTGSTILNNYTLRLFEITGSSTLSSQLYSKSSGAVGQTISSTGTGDEFSLNLTGDFGTTGPSGTGLLAGTNYYMSFDFNFTGNADVWIQGLDPSNANYNTTIWTPTGSYSTQNSANTLNQGLNASVPYAYALEAVAVPEPGTLLLGGIAAVGGAGGWWARRRKKAVPADVTPEGEQAATV